ncbi:hypothetical protein NS14008_36405 [Nocardia seriolae]|nr:hypothetical protein NS14008_36405 [Nocardia seriolae]PSK30287.1 DUF2142 domain-containing protein [Nocardia seriolae]QOW32390.1 DUF2142 domain-containing protein [Nocardia seriolae]QUN19997.1 DUF2142 domain-containing protein [Nocardia seriolae]
MTVRLAGQNPNGEAESDTVVTETNENPVAVSEQTPAKPEKIPAAQPEHRSGLRRAVIGVERRFGSAAVLFILIAGIFGAVWSVLTPPFWGHDEITQFGRAYQVAHGGFLPEKIHDDRGPAWGGDVPVSIDTLMSYAFHDYNDNPDEPEPMVADPHAYDELGAAAVSDETKQVWFTNTAAYSPIPYLPPAAGIRIAEALDLNVGGMVLATRWAGLIAYLVIVGFALRVLRGHRVQWLAFTVAVLPIALFQAGTVTTDTVTNALALLLSALVVKGLFLGERLSKPETVAALATTVLLPVCKPTYVLIAMLTVLIPARRFHFGSRSGFDGTERVAAWQRVLPWATAAVGALVCAVWMKIAAPTGDGMSLMRPEKDWGNVRPGDQLHGILTDPAHFLRVFGDSIARRDQLWFTQFFGALGFSYVEVPALTILASLLAFIVSIGVAERFAPRAASRLSTWVVLLTVAASVAMIYVTLYMSFTPVGYYIIDGVQGRYFVPLAVLALAVLLRWMPLRLTDAAGRFPVRGAAVTVAGATSVALIAAVVKYATIVWG